MVNWDGGNLSGSGTVTIDPGAVMNIATSNNYVTLAQQLVNDGVIDWTTGSVDGQPGGSLVNLGTVATSTTGNTTLADAGDGAFSVVNQGLLTASGAEAGVAEIDGLATSGGAIEVSAGSLLLRPPSGITTSLTGGATVATGSTLDLESAAQGSTAPGGWLLPSTASLTGAGNLDIDSIERSEQSLAVELAGTDTLPTLTVGSPGNNEVVTLTVDGALTLSALTDQGGATLTGAGSIRIPSSGTAAISGNLTGALDLTAGAGAALTWDAPDGLMTGTGTTTIQAGATAVIAPEVSNLFEATLSRPLVNDGTLEWTAGTITATGGSLTNAGTLSLTPDTPTVSDWPLLQDQSGGVFTLADTAAGNIAVHGGAADWGAELDGLRTSNGPITVTGSLLLRPPSGITTSLTGGATVATGSTLDLESAPAQWSTAPGGWLLPCTASLTGTGNLTIGTAAIEGQPGLRAELAGADHLPTLTVANCTLDIDTNTLSLATYTQSASATLQTVAAGPTSYGSIATTGGASIAGSVAPTLSGTYHPPIGQAFSIVRAAGGLTGTFATVTDPPGESLAGSYTATTATLTRVS